jgi:hypothetical protein
MPCGLTYSTYNGETLNYLKSHALEVPSWHACLIIYNNKKSGPLVERLAQWPSPDLVAQWHATHQLAPTASDSMAPRGL